MKKPRAKKHWPAPPEEIEDEALLEWNRVCEELELAGRLSKADRALLHVYVELWSLHRRAVRAVSIEGFKVIHANETVGLSPAYHVMKDSARQLRTLLNDLGLTPAKRRVPAEEETKAVDDLEF